MVNQTQDLIGSFGWKEFGHPLYCCNLVHGDYHLFLHLDRQCHKEDDAVKMTTLQWLLNQVAVLSKDGIQKLIGSASLVMAAMKKNIFRYRLSCKNKIVNKSTLLNIMFSHR